MRSAIRCVCGTASMRATYVTDAAVSSHASMRTSAGAAAWAAGAASAAIAVTTSMVASRTCIRLLKPGRETPVAALAATFRGAALEPLDAAAGVHELLTTRVEGMTVRADLDVQLGLGRTRGEL